MSKIKKIEHVQSEVVYGFRCDNCGKTVEGDECIKTWRGDRDMPDPWHHFSSGHSDWGNNSIDSFEDHDACSFPCYVEIVRERLEYWDEKTLTIDLHERKFLEEMVRAVTTIQ